MKFKITSKQGDKTLIHYYDNITQDIETEDHIPVFLDQDPRCQPMVEQYSIRDDQLDEPKSNHVKHLRIQMGLNCNFHCKYCNQAPDRNAYKPVRQPYEVEVKNLIKKLIDNHIQTNRITLWGGEPLVYWKLMKLLVSELKRIFPGVKISTISNGSLLNEKITDWLIENDINFTLSHDAYSFNVYRDDKNPLDDPVIMKCLQRMIDVSEQAAKPNNDLNFGFSINVVITPENCQLEKIDQYFTEKFGRPVNWHFESIVKCDKTSVNVISKFDEQHMRALLQSMLVTGTSDPKGQFWSIRQSVSQLLGYLINRVDANRLPYSCDVHRSNILAVDMNGVVLACHGSDPQTMAIGCIDDLPHTINTKAIPWKDRKNCPSCPVLISCRSGCCITDDQDNEIMCTNLKLWHSGLFACAWLFLFNALIQRIEPVTDEY